ncbi:hypothetical protein EKN49_15230 [Enterobacter roggenkampii]|nr:S-type pyocin domain-containing protein [Enterobacter roggenkampii]RTO93008.1 hypothetical protein EKN49_15230 [Enterobacter roggenkampii]
MVFALYIPSAGEDSGNVPGRDEFWYEEELRQKALAGAKATTRVRFFWRQDEQGNMRFYGVHTGEYGSTHLTTLTASRARLRISGSAILCSIPFRFLRFWNGWRPPRCLRACLKPSDET